jgi:hypothetical protein
MADQYQIFAIRPFPFDREPEPIRGTLYRCIICDERPIKVKGVLEELTGAERTQFKRKFNAMHSRHKRVCVAKTEEPSAGGGAEAAADGVSVVTGGGDVGAAVAGGNGESSGGEEGVGAGADGSGGTADGAGSENSEEEEEPPPPPPPLDPTKIGWWTKRSVEDALVHWGEMPAHITGINYLPLKFGNPKLECFLKNEHGVNRLILSATVLSLIPELKAQYEAAEARWHNAQHQDLVNLFERACAETSHEAVLAALNALLHG